ncbi:hydroxyisourate hydrolase [Plectosphaerella cucumerina]|uniref:5-hydroxyisourate hydrolase n=1 Tax=Plectosphaerella cucumerina TaxID=40658 RepID=A0A8K0T9V4_9PEZI|nr:hydroxyisourate hydrolase [Plectosphaerella cucumerina]
MAAPQAKDRITCHILDTTTGRPARGVRVQLSSTPAPSTTDTLTSAPKTFESLTDDDGRIKVWLPYSDPHASGEVPVYTLEDVLGGITGPSRWTLRFDVEGHYSAQGIEPFFPEVVVVFTVLEGQGYHVPLLLGPYNYTTYRGS